MISIVKESFILIVGFFSSFLGTTRNNFEGKKVISLEYEAYLPMAENEIRKIYSDIRQKWPVKHIAVFHRLGYDLLYQFES
jgi:molybdopterin synthase catalytic subunit